jgi:hypothetical protein
LKPIKLAAELFDDSPYLCKEMYWDSPVFLTIDRVEGGHKIPKAGTGQTDDRPVVFFRERKQGLVLNSANKKFLIRQLGSICQHWQGERVLLYVDQSVTFGRDKTGGLRLAIDGDYSGDQPPPKPAAKPAGKPAAKPAERPEPPRFSELLSWIGKAKWGGKPLSSAPLGELETYRAAVSDALDTAKPRQESKLREALCHIDGAIESAIGMGK